MLDKVNTSISTFPEFGDYIESLFKSATLNKWPNLLRSLRYNELLSLSHFHRNLLLHVFQIA